MNATMMRGDRRWTLGGTLVVLAIIGAILFVVGQRSPTLPLEQKARRKELVTNIRLLVGSASEAEQGAVLAVTDKASARFTAEARADEARLSDAAGALDVLVRGSGTEAEKELATQLDQRLRELLSVDDQLLGLAVQNTNVKAYNLAYGPAAQAIAELDGALAHVTAGSARERNAARIAALASQALIAALRIQALLPPHIAEESDPKMDDLEQRMSAQATAASAALTALRPLIGPAHAEAVSAASAAWSRFEELRARIIQFSRANTNVRSLAISLTQRKQAEQLVQQTLTALEAAVDAEQPPGEMRGRTVSPR